MKGKRIDLNLSMTEYYLSFFLFGESQALTRRELQDRIGCTERELRLIVALIRRNSNGDSVLVASNAGYYLTNNPAQIRRWIMRSRAHLRSFEKELHHAEFVLNQKGGRQHEQAGNVDRQ